jgi:tRNA G46 methylase TrmB
MVNAELVETVVDKLSAGGKIFVQTDIGSLAEEMCELFTADNRLSSLAIVDNVFAVKTEREKAVEEKDLEVHRSVFVKTQS